MYGAYHEEKQGGNQPNTSLRHIFVDNQDANKNCSREIAIENLDEVD
jgi:hypothetical protein